MAGDGEQGTDLWTPVRPAEPTAAHWRRSTRWKAAVPESPWQAPPPPGAWSRHTSSMPLTMAPADAGTHIVTMRADAAASADVRIFRATFLYCAGRAGYTVRPAPIPEPRRPGPG